MESALAVGAVLRRSFTDKGGKHSLETFPSSPRKNKAVAELDCCKVIFTHGLRRQICAVQDAPVEHVVRR